MTDEHVFLQFRSSLFDHPLVSSVRLFGAPSNAITPRLISRAFTWYPAAFGRVKNTGLWQRNWRWYLWCCWCEPTLPLPLARYYISTFLTGRNERWLGRRLKTTTMPPKKIKEEARDKYVCVLCCIVSAFPVATESPVWSNWPRFFLPSTNRRPYSISLLSVAILS